jgi:hypothetical protein
MVAAFMAVEKVAVTATVIGTPVPPLAGVSTVTVGADAVPTVVKVQVKLAAIGFPEESVTPLLPPSTAAVYEVVLARAAEGVSVATWVAEL